MRRAHTVTSASWLLRRSVPWLHTPDVARHSAAKEASIPADPGSADLFEPPFPEGAGGQLGSGRHAEPLEQAPQV